MKRGIDVGEDKVWVSVEATINLGNYENIKITSGASRTLAPKENEQDVREEMIEEMIEEVLSHGKEVKSKKRRE